MDNIYQADFDEKYVFYLELVIQRNLLLLLKIADISVEKFAASLGVTAQTIRNLSAYETFISRTQFISIMSMFEMERREGINKESVDAFLGILLNVRLFEKYSNNIIKFSEKNIFPEKRKLTKRNIPAGRFAVIGALVGISFVISAPIAPVAAGIAVSTDYRGRAVSRVLDSIDSKEKDKLNNDFDNLKKSNKKDSFVWMKSLYNVKDSLQSSIDYKNFIEEFKKCESDDKGKLFDKYIKTLLNELCTKQGC